MTAELNRLLAPLQPPPTTPIKNPGESFVDSNGKTHDGATRGRRGTFFGTVSPLELAALGIPPDEEDILWLLEYSMSQIFDALNILRKRAEASAKEGADDMTRVKALSDSLIHKLEGERDDLSSRLDTVKKNAQSTISGLQSKIVALSSKVRVVNFP